MLLLCIVLLSFYLLSLLLIELQGKSFIYLLQKNDTQGYSRAREREKKNLVNPDPSVLLTLREVFFLDILYFTADFSCEKLMKEC
jgi:hypothetical protein